ncbi:hypothetical protein Vadar_012170 [Vaccinium darrowii]|uniref:Uncharacterized protein n=1 Tax=Vaccinium darrowii TaxID=229202 RepID=A0ACB7Y050_9ERIC|nr:hypothetical protein Vadar_012170 [Vaccinium darrowii]
MKTLVEEEDRISQLPNDILVNILSLVNIVEAASTCILSKRWQYMWTHVNALNFYSPKMVRAIEKVSKDVTYVRTDEYVDLVNRVMQLHQGPCITNFIVFFLMTGREFRCDIDEWFSFAIRKSVQRLEFNLSGSTLLGGRTERNIVGFTRVVPLPNKLYSLTDKVYSLVKSPYGLSCMQSLTQLSLTCVNVTGELIERFLSNCPLLLGLRVCFSQCLVNLKVAGPSLCLKFLEISRCPLLDTVDIYAPNLASLICLGLEKWTRVLVRHAPLLADLTVECHGPHGGFLNDMLASCFWQLESLTLSFDFGRDTFTPPPLPEFTNLKNLTFTGFANEEDSFLDWTCLIERSPVLLTFTLKLMSPKRIRRQIQNRTTESRLHRCLEVVTFVGNIDFELLHCALQHAGGLRTIIVDCRPPSLEPWQEFKENDSSMELRNHALNLKRQLPSQVDVVCHGVAQTRELLLMFSNTLKKLEA